jgi:hypothetical protein
VYKNLKNFEELPSLGGKTLEQLMEQANDKNPTRLHVSGGLE